MKTTALILVSLLAATIPTGAHAADSDAWRVHVTVTSIHFAEVPEHISEYNNRNWGVRVDKMVTEGEYIFAGEYRNSFYHKCELKKQCDEISYYFGGGSIFHETEHVRLAYEFGYVTGYEANQTAQLPGGGALIAGVAASIEFTDNHAVDVLFALPGFIGIGYQYGFNSAW